MKIPGEWEREYGNPWREGKGWQREMMVESECGRGGGGRSVEIHGGRGGWQREMMVESECGNPWWEGRGWERKMIVEGKCGDPWEEGRTWEREMMVECKSDVAVCFFQ